MIYTPDFLLEIQGYDKPIALEVRALKEAITRWEKKLFIMFHKEYYFFSKKSNEIKDLNKILK